MISKQELFLLGIGSWGVGGFAEKDTSKDQLQLDAITHMFNCGMNFVEANMWYSQGHSVELLAQALQNSTKQREDIFICQTIYLKDYGLNKAESEIDQVLKLFSTDFVDTLQFNQSCFVEFGFDAVSDFVKRMLTKGKASFTSITNHDLDLLKNYHKRFGNKLFSHEVVLNFEIRANQELGIIPYAKANDILTVVYQPLRRNRSAQQNWPLLAKLARKYHVSQNQILMAWHVNNGYLPLTKSETIAHIDQHIQALNLSLDPSDLEQLNNFSPPGYQSPPIDWNNSGVGTTIDQLSNTFDDDYRIQQS